MTQSIVTIGFKLLSDSIEYDSFRSRTSLLDFDIISFRTSLSDFVSLYTDTFQGKPCLDDNKSFQLRETLSHWRNQLKQAVEAGKTVIVFLAPVETVFIATGEKHFTGTGRNQRTTRMVEPVDNYNCLPISAQFSNATGLAMKLTARGVDLIGDYWGNWGEISKYNLTIESNSMIPTITTRTGERPVGALLRHARSSGCLLLMPDINFSPPSNSDVGEEDKQLEQYEISVAKFIKSIVHLYKKLQTSIEFTAEPQWASSDAYSLSRERYIKSKLIEIERELEAAQETKSKALAEISETSRLRALLYEKGKPLEAAIILALKLLGFNASNYKDTQSEFDVIFESAEGRLLGEAEGKETKAINVDKLRQLTMNIHEDLQRDEVDGPAKGVLFGNGFRLTPVVERPCQFTDKCIAAARQNSVALVSTSELFIAAQYLHDQQSLGERDEGYEAKC